jgi:NADPH2:quinone reductase
LHQALEIQKGETLLIRGGTSSIGLLACQLAKTLGVTVFSTTRNAAKTNFLKENGADHVLIDDGTVADGLRAIYPKGVNKVLELIGTRTLKDSLKCIAPRGVVCMTGILSGEWTMKEFTPMGDIPSTGRLTVFMSDVENVAPELLQAFIDAVANGSVKLNIDRTFKLDDIAEAHTYMESNKAKGKLVVEL